MTELSQKVAELEKSFDELLFLTGQIIATVEVNWQRGLLQVKDNDPKSIGEFNLYQKQWKEQFVKIDNRHPPIVKVASNLDLSKVKV